MRGFRNPAGASPGATCALLLISFWLLRSVAAIEIAVDFEDAYKVKLASEVPPERRVVWPVVSVVCVGDEERCNCPDALDALWVESEDDWHVNELYYKRTIENDLGNRGALAVKVGLFDVQKAARAMAQMRTWANPQDCKEVSRKFNVDILNYVVNEELPKQISRLPSDDPILRGDSVDGPTSVEWNGIVYELRCRSPGVKIGTAFHVCKAGEIMDIFEARTSTQKQIRATARVEQEANAHLKSKK